MSGQSAQGVTHWLQGGFDKLLAALHFSGAFVRSSEWAYLAVPVLALAGALLTRAVWTRVLLAACVAVPVLALTFFSGGLWNDYWGAIAMPMLLTLVPLAAGLAVPSDQARLDARAAARHGHGGYRVGPRGGDPATLAAFEASAKVAWEDGADVVVGSRLAPGARLGGPVTARCAAWAGARALSWLCRCVCPVPGLRDAAAPLALVDAEVLKAMPPDAKAGVTADGAASAPLLVWAREHARVREVPLREAEAPGRLPWRLVGSLAAARLRELLRAG